MVILCICWCYFKIIAKMQHVLTENLVLGVLGRHFCSIFAKPFGAFFGVAVKGQFWNNFCRFRSPKGSLFEFISQNLQILHAKKRVEIEARKKMTFGRLLRGHYTGGVSCLAMQILQIFLWILSRHAPPSGVRRILRAAPIAAGPYSRDVWFLVILCLVSLLKCVLARLFLDVNYQVTFLTHNYHFGHRYGRFWCPEPVIWQAGCSTLAPWGTMGRSRGTWEHTKTRPWDPGLDFNRFWVDFGTPF